VQDLPDSQPKRVRPLTRHGPVEHDPTKRRLERQIEGVDLRPSLMTLSTSQRTDGFREPAGRGGHDGAKGIAAATAVRALRDTNPSTPTYQRINGRRWR
jgi:hypothetical protein